jgi:hypothetical protein
MALSNQDSNANQKFTTEIVVAGGALGTNGFRPPSVWYNPAKELCWAISKAQLKALDKEVDEKRVPIDEALNIRLRACDAQRDACKNPNPRPLYDPAGDAARNAKCEQEYKECTQTAKDKHLDELDKLSSYYNTQFGIILSQREACILDIDYPPPPSPNYA